MTNQLEQLKEHTIVVADSGDVNAIKRLKPQDATTNPSLIYKAAKMEEYASLVDDAVKYGKGDLGLVMVSTNFCSTPRSNAFFLPTRSKSQSCRRHQCLALFVGRILSPKAFCWMDWL